MKEIVLWGRTRLQENGVLLHALDSIPTETWMLYCRGSSDLNGLTEDEAPTYRRSLPQRNPVSYSQY